MGCLLRLLHGAGALFMGIYMRFLRPGRVGGVSVIGIVLAGGLFTSAAYLTRTGGPALTFKDTTVPSLIVRLCFRAAAVWLILARATISPPS